MIDAERSRCVEAGERLPPERLGLGQVLLLEPGDVVAVGARAGQHHLLALREGLVVGEDLVEDKWQ